MMQKSRESS